MLTIDYYYTMAEAARELGVAASAVKRFLLLRDIKITRVNGLQAVDKVDVDRLAENKRRFGKYGK